MGADLVPAMSKWIVAEMVRLVYNTDVKTATDVVDPLIDRTLPALACGLDLAASAPTGAQSEACLTRQVPVPAQGDQIASPLGDTAARSGCRKKAGTEATSRIGSPMAPIRLRGRIVESCVPKVRV